MLRVILTIGAIQFLAILVNLIRSKAVAVLLGPEGVGTISVIDQVVQFAAYLSAFSLPLASVKFLSRAHSKTAEEFQRTYSSFLALLFVLAAAGTSTMVGLVIFRPQAFGATLSRLQMPMLLAAASIPAMSLLGFFTNVLAAARMARSSALLAVVTNSLQTFGVLIGLMAASILGLYAGTLLVNTILVAGMLFYLHRSLGLRPRVQVTQVLREMAAHREVFGFSLCLYLGAAAYSSGLLTARMAVLSKMGESSAGLLQALISLAAAIGLVLNPTNGLYLTPIMNRDIGREEKIRAATEFQKRLILLLALIGMPMALFPDVLLQTLFSSRFLPAAPFMYLFVTAQCILQIAGVYQAVLIGLDDLVFYTLFTCAGFGTLAVLAKALAPAHGIAGVGLAFIVGSSLVLVACALRLNQKFYYSLPASVWTLMVYMVAGMLAGGVLLGGRPASDWSVTMLKVGVYVSYTAGLIVLQGREERNAGWLIQHGGKSAAAPR